MIGLKKIRKKRNLNQQKVALDLNISREALSYINAKLKMHKIAHSKCTKKIR